MKKVVTMLAVLGLGLTLVGCGGDAPAPKKDTPKAEAPKKAEPKKDSH